MAEVRITARCRREDIPQLPKDHLSGFVNKLEILADDPCYGKPLRDELKRYRSIPLGRYRIVYRYDRDADVVWAVAVGIRKEGSKADIYARVIRLVLSDEIE